MEVVAEGVNRSVAVELFQLGCVYGKGTPCERGRRRRAAAAHRREGAAARNRRQSVRGAIASVTQG